MKYNFCERGLSINDQLVLRSVFRLTANSTAHWHQVAPCSEADVILLGPMAESLDLAEVQQSAALCIPILGTQEPAISGLSLRQPLRGTEVAETLRRALEMVTAHNDSRNSQSKDFSLTDRRTPAIRVIHQLLDIEYMASVPLCLRLGPTHVAFFEVVDSCNGPKSILWRSPTLPNLGTLCQLIKEGAPYRLQPIDDLQKRTRPPLSAGSLSQLLWILSAYQSNSVYEFETSENARFMLHRWPDFGKLPTTTSQLRLAALMVRRPTTLKEAITQTGISQTEAIAFLNACYHAGWIEITSRCVTEDLVLTEHSESLDGLSRLLQGIRKALRRE